MSHKTTKIGGPPLDVLARRAGLPPRLEPDSGEPAPQEIVLDGRKYRLVPVAAEPSPPREEPPRSELRPPHLLTARELQIVALVAEGRANKQIAAELHISEWTVSTHLRRIYAKLDVDNRAAMVTRCFVELGRPL